MSRTGAIAELWGIAARMYALATKGAVAWSEGEHPRAEDGKFGSGSGGAKEQTPNAAAKAALKKHKVIDASVQRYAEEHNEPKLAKAVGGVSFPDSEPVDVAVPADKANSAKWQEAFEAHREATAAFNAGDGPKPEKFHIDGGIAHGLEMKTMVGNEAGQISMKRSALKKKAAWERKHGVPIHTVVLDDQKVFNAKGEGKHDESKRKIYYRRGYGAFTVNAMHEVKDMDALKKLIDTPDKELPEAARRPKGQRLGRLKPSQKTVDHDGSLCRV